MLDHYKVYAIAPATQISFKGLPPLGFKGAKEAADPIEYLYFNTALCEG